MSRLFMKRGFGDWLELNLINQWKVLRRRLRILPLNDAVQSRSGRFRNVKENQSLGGHGAK
jgi:hypothetical protein